MKGAVFLLVLVLVNHEVVNGLRDTDDGIPINIPQLQAMRGNPDSMGYQVANQQPDMFDVDSYSPFEDPNAPQAAQQMMPPQFANQNGGGFPGAAAPQFSSQNWAGAQMQFNTPPSPVAAMQDGSQQPAQTAESFSMPRFREVSNGPIGDASLASQTAQPTQQQQLQQQQQQAEQTAMETQQQATDAPQMAAAQSPATAVAAVGHLPLTPQQQDELDAEMDVLANERRERQGTLRSPHMSARMQNFVSRTQRYGGGVASGSNRPHNRRTHTNPSNAVPQNMAAPALNNFAPAMRFQEYTPPDAFGSMQAPDISRGTQHRLQQQQQRPNGVFHQMAAAYQQPNNMMQDSANERRFGSNPLVVGAAERSWNDRVVSNIDDPRMQWDPLPQGTQAPSQPPSAAYNAPMMPGNMNGNGPAPFAQQQNTFYAPPQAPYFPPQLPQQQQHQQHQQQQMMYPYPQQQPHHVVGQGPLRQWGNPVPDVQLELNSFQQPQLQQQQLQQQQQMGVYSQQPSMNSVLQLLQVQQQQQQQQQPQQQQGLNAAASWTPSAPQTPPPRKVAPEKPPMRVTLLSMDESIDMSRKRNSNKRSTHKKSRHGKRKANSKQVQSA